MLIFTTYDDDQMFCDAVAAGARGYLLKSAGKHTLYMAVERAIGARRD
jgi:DNA-binding NarL/FixJ family response regulator